jgi:hypothetical protein
MRSRPFVLSVTLLALAHGLLLAAPAVEAGDVSGLDGQVHMLEVSKSITGQLNYQGYLANAADSSAVTATLQMTFRLFDSETKGTELWAETHPAVEVNGGLFQVLLGSVTPFPGGLFDATELWLQTELGSEILAPRKSLVSVAYSHRANSAEMLEDNTLTDLDGRWVNEADLDHLDAADGDPTDAVYVDDAGKVGLGTTSPLTELDVNGSVNATAYYGDGSNLTGIAGTPDADWTVAGNHMYSAVPGSVGVGTSSPEKKLHVAGDVKATTYYGDGSNLTGISGTTDNDWTIDGDNVYHETGSVGIGTTSPSAKLDVGGTVNTDSLYQIEGAPVLSVEGEGNISVGLGAGTSNTGTWNTFIGDSAGYANTTGSHNTFLGTWAGRNDTEGEGNTFIGKKAGYYNTTGNYNVFMGLCTGYMNTVGETNTFLGTNSGYSHIEGNANTFMGKTSGFYNQYGDSNVFIGSEAGFSELGSHKLYIANGRTAGDVLIYGDFSTGHIGLGTLAPDTKLEVQGAQDDYALIKIDQTGTNQYAGLRLDRDDAEKWFIGMPHISDNFIFRRTASSNDMVIDTTGNVGIGTASPQSPLHIYGASNRVLRIEDSGDEDTWLEFKSNGQSDWSIGVRENQDDLYLTPGYYTGTPAVMVKRSDGHVAIGKTYANYKLDVNGAVSTDSVYKIGGNTVLSTEGDYNLFVGWGTGWSNTTGQHNTFVGQYAGYDNTEGDYNTFIGQGAGNSNTLGYNNLFVGESAGHENTTGFWNTFLGNSAGYYNTTGMRNTFLGRDAGFATTTGSGNVFIGDHAGAHETGSDKLFIANNWDTSSVIIYGDFSTGNVGLGTLSPERKLHIVGDNPRVLIEASSSNPELNFHHSGEPTTSTWSIYKEAVSGDLRFFQNGNRLTIQKNTGNVGIGNSTPGYKLDVAGDINTTGDIRKNGSSYNHPDYVFEPGYELLPVEELEDYLSQNKHLPGMPSAGEVREEGVKLFEQNRLLLEKLEESYLYIAELQKRIERLETLCEKDHNQQ